MVKARVKLSVEEIIESLRDLDSSEREKLQSALFELESDLGLQNAIRQGLDDKKNGRVSAHDAIMKEIKEKYNQ
jgi:hypothetical protein